jgi:hypothetical protein
VFRNNNNNNNNNNNRQLLNELAKTSCTGKIRIIVLQSETTSSLSVGFHHWFKRVVTRKKEPNTSRDYYYLYDNFITISKGKDKVHPIKGHEGPKKE